MDEALFKISSMSEGKTSSSGLLSREQERKVLCQELGKTAMCAAVLNVLEIIAYRLARCNSLKEKALPAR